MLTKDSPDIVPLSFPLSESSSNCTVLNMADIEIEIDEETALINTAKGGKKGFIEGGKIKGSYNDHISILMKKHIDIE